MTNKEMTKTKTMISCPSKISVNVLGIRRSSPPYKALRSKAVGWNVGERKHHKGRKPDWCFSNPEPPDRRRSVYRLLDDVNPFSVYFLSVILLLTVL